MLLFILLLSYSLVFPLITFFLSLCSTRLFIIFYSFYLSPSWSVTLSISSSHFLHLWLPPFNPSFLHPPFLLFPFPPQAIHTPACVCILTHPSQRVCLAVWPPSSLHLAHLASCSRYDHRNIVSLEYAEQGSRGRSGVRCAGEANVYERVHRP